MGARTDLVTALTAALDPDVYRVVGSPDTPDQIEVNTFAVRVWADQISPGPQVGSVLIDLTLWVLTASLEPGTADDLLDGAYADVAGALHALDWTTEATAHRDVMADRWNGWRFTTQAAGQIT